MNAFHVFWSPSPEKRDFKDYFVLTLILSAMQWRRTNPGRLTFYGDSRTVEYLEKNHLCSLWSVCDGQTLDREIDKRHYDVAAFYTIGKFIAFLKEQGPCALVDVDLVVWENLESILEGKEVSFSHWEESPDFSAWYCEPEKLSIRPGYHFHPQWDFRTRAANTSFIYFRNDKEKKYYANCALEYMWDNPVAVKKTGNPELIFVEQRLLNMCIEELGLTKKAGPLLDVVWDAGKGRFVNGKTMPNGWPFFEWDNGCIMTHIWNAKPAIDQNELYRNYMCCRAVELILALDHTLYDILSDIEPVQKYLKMLSVYKTADKLVKAGKASKILYP